MTTAGRLTRIATNLLSVRRLVLCALILGAVTVAGQQSQTGMPAFSSAMSFGPTSINLSNLDIHFSRPVFSKPGRGLPLNYSLTYDSLMWSPNGTSPKLEGMGWVRTGPAGWMQVYDTVSELCYLDNNYYNVLGFGPFTDANGAVHLSGGISVAVGDPCLPGPGATGPLNDGSGMTYIVTPFLSIDFQFPDGTVIEPLHVRCTGPLSACTSVGGSTITDPNGNLIYEELNPNPNQVADTTGSIFAVGGDYWTISSLGYTDSNGKAQTVSISYDNGNVQGNFGCPGATEFPASALGSQLVTQIAYPDGSYEQFAYEATPGFPTSTTGRIASMTLRTGGTINFAYTGGNHGLNCSDGSTAGLTITTSDSTVGWSFQHSLGTGKASTTTVNDPKGNQMVISFQNGFEVQRQIYSASGTLLETIVTCYNGNKTNCTTATVKMPITEVSAITVLPNGQQKEQDSLFNSTGLNTEVDEYDFGAGSPGALLRKSLTTYASLGNNILGRPASVTVCSPSGSDSACNGTGTRIAQSTYGYDETALTATSGLPQHGSVSGARGNLTSIHRWLNTTGSTLNTTSTFDDAGRVLTTADANGNSTSFAYGCYDAYVNKVTLPATGTSHLTSATYDCNTGLTLSATDQNGQITSFSYDEILRPTQTTFADGGQTTISYPSTTQVVSQSKIDSSRLTYSTALVDGYGRISRTAVANGESTPYDQQDFCYDSDGLLGFKSYPYQGNTPVFGSGPVCTGAGDSFTYDALGRSTKVTHSDGTASTTTYTGRAVQFADEGNGSFQVSRILQADSLGRLANVCELYSGNSLLGNGGAPGNCALDISGTGFLTSYSYDLLGNLASVAQGSVNSRSYGYDSLSRMTSATDPESATNTYSYDFNGNLLSMLDARGITTTYAYDALNRLTQKSYSDGKTPTANFVYDTDPGWTNPAAPATNVIGRLSEAYTSPFVAAEIFGYDSVGRVVMNNQCTPANCGAANWPLGYTYDFLGDMTSAGNGVSVNGVSVTFNYSYNIEGRLTGLTSSFNDANHPSTLLSGVHYSPSVLTDTLGNAVVETANLSPRGQLQSYLGTAPGGAPGTGSVTINGTLQTYQQQTQAATPGTGSLSISGSDRYIKTPGPCHRVGNILVCDPPTYTYDSGTITVTVNGFTTASVAYGEGSTPSGLASGVATALNVSGSPVTATASGSTVTMTAIATGASTNYSWSSNSATNHSGFTGTSFPVSPSSGALSGGQNAVYQTVYDNGSTTITVNSHPDSYSWSGSATTAASIAQGLCNTINGDTGAFVTASTNGSAGQCPLGSATVSLVSKQNGQNYALSASSSSVVNSFSTSCPGSSNCSSGSLSGGGNPAYSFTLGLAPDGQITSATDFVNGNWTFAYDAFNRLASSNKNSGQQTFSYGYDVAGNRWQQNAPQGGPAPQYTFDNNNHFGGSGVTYDAAGNVLTDGLGNSFTWDAEGRMTQVNQGSTVVANYVYDATGRRVHGPNGEYLYDLAGRMITQIALNGVWAYGEIYSGRRHLATYSGDTTNFFHSDWLGTKRAMTAVNGTVSETCTGFAFGDGVNCTGTNWSYNGFTDLIHDPETNLERALFRQYSGTQGRWMSPDPDGSGAADLANPQSLNQYAYANGNPVNSIDPLGLEDMPPCFMCGGPGGEIGGNFFGGPFRYDEGSPCNDPLYAGVHPLGCPIVGGGGLSINISGLGGGGLGVVNCFASGRCPNIPLPYPSLADHLGDLPWNNPCILSSLSDGCGIEQDLQSPTPTPTPKEACTARVGLIPATWSPDCSKQGLLFMETWSCEGHGTGGKDCCLTKAGQYVKSKQPDRATQKIIDEDQYLNGSPVYSLCRIPWATPTPLPTPTPTPRKKKR